MTREYETSLETIKDLIGMFEPAEAKASQVLRAVILKQQGALYEAIYKAEQEISLLSQTGPTDPNCFKRGACFTLWISRLKPYRVPSIHEIKIYDPGVIANLVDINRYGQIDDFRFEEGRRLPRLFVNELIATMVGAGLSEKGDSHGERKITYSVKLSSSVFHDILIGLRYGNMTSESLSIVYEGASTKNEY